ncbi:UDP-glucuronosyltransferase 3A1-like [Cryptotermes secundus]|uniref:UDP-glucuronosyltransferase 3A1-like n=1 Tax=Cryptotermes secundus TaxID=105785 RepID=UPI001454E405|nr:UDP-glucuronosyltransferase 3A1-like [Cryptotermes secundus]
MCNSSIKFVCTFQTHHIYFFFLLYTLQRAESSKILAIFAHVGKSHFDVFEPLLEELAARDHQLLVISYFPQYQFINNYKNIDLRGILQNNKTAGIINIRSATYGGHVKSALRLGVWGNMACEKTLEHPSVQNLVTSEEKFDLIITELFNTDCFLAFAHKFNIPTIAFSSSDLMPWANSRFGNPDNPSHVPLYSGQSTGKMIFSERLLNTFWYLFHKLHHLFLMEARANKFARKHFGESLPALSQLARNTSLIFVNRHFSLNGPRPLVPGVIEVAGIHMKPVKKLPEVRLFSHLLYRNYIVGRRIYRQMCDKFAGAQQLRNGMHPGVC